ncbi:MAG: hypothetical protein KAT41_02960, partial [Candidatus Marinimicrobia bacterium]|nr:hypothetical protein [Candidatus Neomarinimicrobiota bacterium]
MSKMTPFLVILLVASNLVWAADYEWVITYPSDPISFRFLASGGSKAIMKAVFEDRDPYTQNTLHKFTVRPVTSHDTQWYIESIQLWWDTDGVDGFHAESDSLIGTMLSSEFGFIQSEPVNSIRVYFNQQQGLS